MSGVTRIWTDASSKDGHGGWGVLILHNGKFSKYRGTFKSSHKVHECERLAMLNAMHIARRMGAVCLDIYSDCEGEVRRFRGELHKGIAGSKGAKQWKRMNRHFRNIDFTHINRKHNHVADKLANLGRKGI